MQDEPFRWSLAKIWGLGDGVPLRYTLITERVAPINPDQSVHLSEHAMPPLRERCACSHACAERGRLLRIMSDAAPWRYTLELSACRAIVPDMSIYLPPSNIKYRLGLPQ